MTALIDFSTLPAPRVIESLDYEAIRAAMLDDLKVRLPEWTADLESDPAVKIIEVAAYRELLLRQRVNDAASSVMIAYAVGSDLDQIGAMFNVTRLAGETDEAYRARVQQGYSLLAAAGPANAYRAHAMGVDASIVDASVTSLAPGQVTVTVLAPQFIAPAEATADEIAAGGALFSSLLPPTDSVTIIARNDAPIMDSVRQALNAEDVRPLTDSVSVRQPTLKTFDISAVLTVYPGPDQTLVLNDAQAALDGYLASIRRMDYDATRAGIIAALTVAGVQNVELSSPAADIVTGPLDLAVCLTQSVTIGGVDV
jgi:phage-related baseplate assembly protein